MTAGTKFGSNLAVPNTTFGCSLAPSTSGFLRTDASQCIWTQGSNGAAKSGSDIIPLGTGRLTQASVRVGSSSGKMEFVLLRAFINTENFNTECCVVLLTSKSFVPKAKAITTETVNFPIVKNGEVVDGDIEIYELLGLRVLSPSTPIPLTSETGQPLNRQPADDAFFGPFTPGTAEDFFGTLGYQLDIRGTYVPS
ncbi:MAG: hypothetical protein ABSC41_14575 [Acidimicrobiales bacterium]